MHVHNVLRVPRRACAVTISFIAVLLASVIPGPAPAAGAASEPALASEAQDAADAESCEINAGVENPTYNTVCPEWVSSFTSEGTDSFEGKLHVSETGSGWFTRASPNSEVFVTAGHYIQATQGQRQAVLVATAAASGERVWARHYATGVASDPPGFAKSVPLAIDFSPDSRHVYVTGWMQPPNTDARSLQLAFVLKVDTATGETVWATTLSDLSAEETRLRWVPQDIKVSPDSDRVYVTGSFKDLRDCLLPVWCLPRPGESQEEAEPPWTPFTAALDTSSGEILWLDEDREHAPAYGWQLAVSPDGTSLYQVQPLLFEGEIYSGGTAHAIRLVSYDPSSGKQIWDARHDYPPPSGVDENRQNLPVGVAVSPDGDRVSLSTSHTYWRRLPGTVDPFVDDVNFLALAWDAATGEQAWTREYDWEDEAGCSGGLDTAAGGALSPSGERLYVVGSVNVDPQRRGNRCDLTGSGSRTIGLLALDTTTGQPAWAKVYHNAGHAVTAPRFAESHPGSDVVILAHNVHVKPGMGAGDEGGQVYMTARAAMNGDIAFVNLAFDGLTGRQVWQTRYTRPGGLTPPGFHAGVLSPDGERYLLTTSVKVSALTPAREDVEVTNVVYPTAGDPPAATLAATPVTGAAPLRVNFDASGSRAASSGAQVTRYRFDFGDGNEAMQTSPAATHTYSSPGTYTATVTIFDSTGAVSNATVTIVVAPT